MTAVEFHDLPLGELEQHIAALPVDAKRIQGLTTTTTINGKIDSTGAITNGTGFTVNRSATGVYDITFTAAFSGVPDVVATPGPAAAIRILIVSAATTTTAQVSTFNTSSTPVNAAFTFAALAPTS